MRRRLTMGFALGFVGFDISQNCGLGVRVIEDFDITAAS
jgi:hypothetical protein